MNKLDLLLKARSELEFFVILSSLLSAEAIGTVKLKNTWSGPEANRPAGTFALTLTISQTISLPDEHTGGTMLVHREIHTFRLTQDGDLTWQMLGQSLMSGLDNIQKHLELLRQALFQTMLPVTATDGHI